MWPYSVSQSKKKKRWKFCCFQKRKSNKLDPNVAKFWEDQTTVNGEKKDFCEGDFRKMIFPDQKTQLWSVSQWFSEIPYIRVLIDWLWKSLTHED